MAQWPKPSAIPLCTLVMLVFNLGAGYVMGLYHLPWYWLLPTGVLNLFFCWAEWDIYRRDRRNYEAWHAEVQEMLAYRGKTRWSENIASVDRRRRRRDKRTGNLWRQQTR